MMFSHQLKAITSVPKDVAIVLIKGYRLVFSPWVGRYCRFEPSCSRYTQTAIERQGLLRGLWLGINRIARCHPGCNGGYDPVPEKKLTSSDKQPKDLV